MRAQRARLDREQELSTTSLGTGWAWRSKSTSRLAWTRCIRPSSPVRASTPWSCSASKSPWPMKCITCHSPLSSVSCRSVHVADADHTSSTSPSAVTRASARVSWSFSLSTSRGASPRGEDTMPRIRSGAVTGSGAADEGTPTWRTSWFRRHTYDPSASSYIASQGRPARAGSSIRSTTRSPSPPCAATSTRYRPGSRPGPIATSMTLMGPRRGRHGRTRPSHPGRAPRFPGTPATPPGPTRDPAPPRR
jgi:hypothetical protein